MGTKKKQTRVFGRSSGINSKRRKEKYVGRPTYKATRSRKPGILSLRIRKVKQAALFIKSRNVHRSVFVSHIIQDGKALRLKIKKVSVKELSPQGYRFVNLESLQTHVTDITMHVCQCPEAIQLSCKGQAPIKLQNEVSNFGLACVLHAQCQGCLMKFEFVTSPKLSESRRFDVNVRAVWGSISTGNGPSHLNEILATLNSPGLSPTTFTAIEEEIGEWWLAALQENMLQAGAEERRLAIERGSYHQGVPAITVITDGGWSKRTHKHTYNAMGGVAIIIGKETSKLLYLGVRNKHCYICSCAEKNKTDAKPHTCYKNWNEDSQSMESDILVQGFQEAESRHGLRYLRIIGDGDSSVFARIRDEVKVWGRYVEKEECANHTCKCYRSNLEKLVSENNLYKGRHHLTKATRVRLVSALRSAIRMRSTELKEKKVTKNQAIQQLRHDIKNSVFHVFGLHANCSNFCKAKTSTTSLNSEKESTTSDQDRDTEPLDIFTEQQNLWEEGSSDKALEESRLGTTVKYSDVEQYIIQDVSTLLARTAERADRLIGNSTTNLAENWMSIRCKFDGGKLYNLCNRGSWHGRCYGGGLRMNYGPKWSPIVWEKSTATKAGFYFDRLYERREKSLISCRKYKAKPETLQNRWKRKMKCVRNNNTKKARKSYGPDATDVAPDISTSELDTLKDDFMKTHINLTLAQLENITQKTLQQSQSELWHTERKKRLTASNFGLIIRRNPSIPVAKLVKSLLYSKFKGNQHTRNGLLQERTTLEEFKLKKAEENIKVTVEQSGMVIDKDNPFLAASPDGIIHEGGDCGLIEIKNLLHSKPINLFEAAERNANFCLEIVNGSLRLKETHIYYYQCQGLLNICKYDWIDFVVRTLNPYHLFVQRITKDESLWNDTMLPKLKAFYFNALLPELASPREGKVPGIREPGIWYTAPVAKRRRSRPAGGKSKGYRRRQGRCHHRESDTSDSESETKPAPCARSSRARKRQVKFVGRRIRHEWVVDPDNGKKEWYEGTVLGILSGKDGVSGAVYEVLYDNEDGAYEVDHLLEDYHKSSVEFLDV